MTKNATICSDDKCIKYIKIYFLLENHKLHDLVYYYFFKVVNPHPFVNKKINTISLY